MGSLPRVSALLRPSSWTLINCVLQRHLTSSETATALRPFLFAVHPDLFGKFPKQRKVNENSLKRLNEYIDGIHERRRVVPTQLTFFLRPTEEARRNEASKVPDTFREVRIALLSACPREIVKTVLRTCNLPTKYVEGLRPSRVPDGSSRRTIIWHHTYYDHYGIPNPYRQASKPKIEVFLDIWLKKNLIKARENQARLKPVLDQIQVQKKRICDEIGICDIQWDSYWGDIQQRACLATFISIMERHRDELHLAGHTVVFGNATGLCLEGQIILRQDEVPNNWVQFLKTIPSHKPIFEKIPRAERRLSQLLNNINVTHHHDEMTMLATTYLKQVSALTSAVERHLLEYPESGFDQDLSDINLVINCSNGPLALSDEGSILVPPSCAAFMLIHFILDNVTEARECMKEDVQRREIAEKLKKQVVDQFGLNSLTIDGNIKHKEMLHCCRHLLKDPRNIGISLHGCNLKVTTFYSVMSDGEICIPWNWRGGYD